MPTKLVSAISFLSAKEYDSDKAGGFAGAGKEHDEEFVILLNSPVDANSLEIEYPGTYADGTNVFDDYTVRGACVLLPNDNYASTYPVIFPGSSRSSNVPTNGYAVGSVATHPALQAGDVIRVRTIHHGQQSGAVAGGRPCYTKFLCDGTNGAGSDKALVANVGATSLSVIDTPAWSPPSVFAQGVDNWVGLCPNVRGNTSTVVPAMYIATHSWGDWNYDYADSNTPTGLDGQKYESYTTWGRLLAKKGYVCLLDQVNGGDGASVVSQWSNTQRQRAMALCGQAGAGNFYLWDHYCINALRITGQTAATAICGHPGGTSGIKARLALYAGLTVAPRVVLSTPTPTSTSNDSYDTVAGQGEWDDTSGGRTGGGAQGGLLRHWKDFARWIRGIPLVETENLAAISAGAMAASAANQSGVWGYCDVLTAMSPDSTNLVCKYQPYNSEGQTVSNGLGTTTNDGLHPGRGFARGIQRANPQILPYSANLPASITGVSTISIEKGSSRALSLTVLDSLSAGLGAIVVGVSTSSSAVVSVSSSETTNGSGVALFDGSNALTVPDTATVGATATLTFTAGSVTKQIVVTVVAAGSLGGGGGGSLINGGLIR